MNDSMLHNFGRVIDFEKVKSLSKAIDVIENVLDDLLFDEAKVIRLELYRVLEVMMQEKDRMEGF
jgi:hypothetical protein